MKTSILVCTSLLLLASAGITLAEIPIDTYKINLNTATVTQLQELNGIGPVLSQRIVDFRVEHGDFERIEEIEKVSGIGPKKFQGFKNLITV